MKKITVRCKKCGKVITVQEHSDDCIFKEAEWSICYKCSGEEKRELQQFTDDFNQ